MTSLSGQLWVQALLFQSGPPPIPASIDPLVYWLVGIMLTTMAGVVVTLWRQSVAEGKRKDVLIDRLLDVEQNNAEANKLSATLLEHERNP